VALGASLLVRLLVPAWVVNATPLPISAIVLPRVRPPPRPPPPQVSACVPAGGAPAVSCAACAACSQCRSAGRHLSVMSAACLNSCFSRSFLMSNVSVQSEAAAPGEGLRNQDALLSAANAMANMRVLESGYDVKCGFRAHADSFAALRTRRHQHETTASAGWLRGL